MHFTAGPQVHVNAPMVQTGAPAVIPGRPDVQTGAPTVMPSIMTQQLGAISFGDDPALVGGWPLWAKVLLGVGIFGALGVGIYFAVRD